MQPIKNKSQIFVYISTFISVFFFGIVFYANYKLSQENETRIKEINELYENIELLVENQQNQETTTKKINEEIEKLNREKTTLKEQLKNNFLTIEKTNTSSMKKITELNNKIKELEKDSLSSEELQTQLNEFRQQITKTKQLSGAKETKEGEFKFEPKDQTKAKKFDDLFGFAREKKLLTNFTNYVKKNNKNHGLGKITPANSVMFYGCPGTGKTILARSVAKETDLPFFEVSASDFSQKYKGDAVNMVKSLFATARKHAKENKKGAVIFIDECESAFSDIGQLSPESEQVNVVNQFKLELEPEDQNADEPIFVIGATNHIDNLEQAILSRFTYKVEIKPEECDGRQKQLEYIINYRQNPYSENAKKYLYEVLNPAIDQYVRKNPDKNHVKAFRVLESMLSTAISQTYNREAKCGEIEDLRFAYLKAIEETDQASNHLKELEETFYTANPTITRPTN